MHFLIGHITEITFALFVAVVLVNLVLVALVFIRRYRRKRYFERLDGFRRRYDPMLSGMISGRLEYAQGIAELKQVEGPGRVAMLERLCLDHRVQAEEVPELRRICEDLGLVEIWQQRLVGRIGGVSLGEMLHSPEGLMSRIKRFQFLARSRSAEALGRIRHEPSWPLLVKTLEEPNPDLQMVSARALGCIRHPGSFAALARSLQRVAVQPGNNASLHSLKSAIVNFALKDAQSLLSSLQHPNARVRSVSIEVIREISRREAASGASAGSITDALGSGITEMLLWKLPNDPDPEVRARAASTLSFVEDRKTAPVLLKLTSDSVWYVRLHAVRSLADPRFLPWSDKIAEAVTDSHWRVREAAVRVLRSFGPEGLDRLLKQFLSTNDRYSREQIADELQRAGLIPELLKEWSNCADSPEGHFVEQMAAMGKTSYMTSVALESNGGGRIQSKFLESFGR